MPENLRETIEKAEAILADPNAPPEEKQYAYIDRAISRRLVNRGVDVLQDDPGEGEGSPEAV
jgi:hypothetical protein